jgi:hypothetical protein
MRGFMLQEKIWLQAIVAIQHSSDMLPHGARANDVWTLF